MKRLRSFLSKRNAKSAQKTQQPLQQQPPPPVQSSSIAPPPQDTAVEVPRPENAQDQTTFNIQAAPGTLNIALRNDTTSSTVYACISGLALDSGNSLFLLQADARTPYYPTSPSTIQQPLQADCAIPLGGPGNTVIAQIPHIAGGRIWFSIDQPLTFKLNPGPALVEPSVTNFSDPNINIDWAFAEFTYNSDQLYANISYVDFVSLPVSLTLDTVNSGTSHVTGMPPTGLQQIADDLRAQNDSDGQGWDQLIINQQGTNTPLRILSPNQGIVTNPNLFSTYFDAYTAAVFQRYTNDTLSIDTQAAPGVVRSTPSPNPASTLVIDGETFSRPTTRDIFSCSTGPFATGPDAKRNAIIPRLAAAFNRSTLLATNSLPAQSSLYYKDPVTNHYSRIVHAANLDGKGYAFPYDDVQPSGGADQSGEVHAGDPQLFTVAVGGARAAG